MQQRFHFAGSRNAAMVLSVRGSMRINYAVLTAAATLKGLSP
jgi:hypothetical protein